MAWVLMLPYLCPTWQKVGQSGGAVGSRLQNRNLSGRIRSRGSPTLCLPGRSYPQGWTRWRLTTWRAPGTALEAWQGEGWLRLALSCVCGLPFVPFKGVSSTDTLCSTLSKGLR